MIPRITDGQVRVNLLYVCGWIGVIGYILSVVRALRKFASSVSGICVYFLLFTQILLITQHLYTTTNSFCSLRFHILIVR